MNRIKNLYLDDLCYEEVHLIVGDNHDEFQPIYIEMQNGDASQSLPIGLTMQQAEDLIGKLIEALNKGK